MKIETSEKIFHLKERGYAANFAAGQFQHNERRMRLVNFSTSQLSKAVT